LKKESKKNDQSKTSKSISPSRSISMEFVYLTDRSQESKNKSMLKGDRQNKII